MCKAEGVWPLVVWCGKEWRPRITDSWIFKQFVSAVFNFKHTNMGATSEACASPTIHHRCGVAGEHHAIVRWSSIPALAVVSSVVAPSFILSRDEKWNLSLGRQVGVRRSDLSTSGNDRYLTVDQLNEGVMVQSVASEAVKMIQVVMTIAPWRSEVETGKGMIGMRE